jgi:hypothetical protein
MSYMYALHRHQNPIWAISVDYWRTKPIESLNYSNTRARNRWKLAYTLLIDPDLIKQRNPDFKKSKDNDIQIEMI